MGRFKFWLGVIKSSSSPLFMGLHIAPGRVSSCRVAYVLYLIGAITLMHHGVIYVNAPTWWGLVWLEPHMG